MLLFLLCLVVFIPIAIILAMFLMARKLERKSPAIGKWFSRSLWIGLLSLLPGLLHVQVHYGGLFSFDSSAVGLGWPLPWLGYTGMGLPFAPFAILVDMTLVAAIALICFSFLRVLERRMPERVSMERIYKPLRLVLVFFPLLMGVFSFCRWLVEGWQYEAWVARNAETAINSIQFKQCSDFALIPSPEHPGTMNIRVSVAARVNEPHDFELSAHIEEMIDNKEYSVTAGLLKQQLSAGEHTLEFIIHPIDVDSDYVRIKKPGPYTIRVVVNRVSMVDGGYGGFFDGDDFSNARTYLGISDENRILICQSPAYTFADLGLPISPTSQP